MAPIHSSSPTEPTYVSNIGPLMQAAHDGRVDQLKTILATGIPVNYQDYDKRTPLHLAAAGGHVETVKFLLEQGATLLPDRFGMFAVHDAVMNHHAEVRSILQEVDLACPGGACYLSPEKVQKLKDETAGSNIALSVEDMEHKMTQVFSLLAKEGVFASGGVWAEIQYYFTELGLHPKYFVNFTSAQIARHIHCLMAAKKVAQTTRSETVHFEIEDENSAFYLTTMDPTCVSETEGKIALYLQKSTEAFSVVFMQSERPPVANGKHPLGIFMVEKTHFEQHVSCDSLADEDDLQLVATTRFLQSKCRETQNQYQSLISEAMKTRNALVRVIDPPKHLVRKNGAHMLQFAAYDVERKGKAYLIEITECLRSHKIAPKRMYIESFANGIVTYALYFAPEYSLSDLENLAQTLRYVSHFRHSPKRSALVWDLVLKGRITPEHSIFLLTAAKFVFTFFPKETEEYKFLAEKFKNDLAIKGKLDELFLQTTSNAITLEKIYDTLVSNIALTKGMFEDFQAIATGDKQAFFNNEISKMIDNDVVNRLENQILKTVLKLNAHLQMTNFFKPGTAAAIAMRFDGGVLADRPRSLFPVTPHGIYMISGRGFYGFHIRFRDIARGGIRMIMSRDKQTYNRNASSLLEENYNLALTQHYKNKDIPEGGSKGTILLDLGDQNLATNGRDSFNKYIDALLDCMMNKEVGIHSHLPTREMLFFGPDENTAGFMDMGAFRAKARNYPYWKALTTGKSTSLGGVPHDVHAMTTNSVHQYVIELLDVCDVDETEITKVQTGGPDGDLGSNEILLSKDKTIAIVDGSGTAYDPNGLDRIELTRLAHARVPIANFNRSKLSEHADCFLISIEERDVTLPNGQTFKSGADVRNQFTSLEYCSADLFVPCGGRPATVNQGNVHTMFNTQKQPKFKFIVEGANLFFTDEARRVMEAAGVHHFKDASTNKGGVTSSSMEVFAALCMDPADHGDMLTIQDPTQPPPEFYQNYVQEIVAVVKQNAKMEFHALWNASHSTMSADESGLVTKLEATYLLSRKINSLKEYTMKVLDDKNADNAWMVRAVLRRCLPRLLLVHCGIGKILDRTPEAYITAVVATWVAKTFVYKYGLDASEFSFYQFMRTLEENSEGEVTPTKIAQRKHIGSTTL